ncbi:DNA internalization-related competence protein ComEC/Rec2 [Bacillus kexueae]|uniref:DNA internalization-related competence protein ComEC/Rec2 n=1 Tax=Aeribacillus kexueae TaxID=2078952 RepID=UPI001FAF0E5C|nr:DNA internalization-related competence protein ComEC/Rec2 [Bacillus kexueae]
MKGHWYLIAVTVLLASTSSYIAFLLFFFIAAKKKSFHFAFFLGLLFCFIMIPNVFVPSEVEYSHENEMVQKTMKIISSPKIDGNKATYELKTNQNERYAAIHYLSSIQEKEKVSTIKAGHRCSMRGTIELPLNHTVENAFNYRDYLQSKGIKAIFSVEEVKECTYTPNLLNRLENARASFKQVMEEHFSDETVGFVLALTIGDRTLIEEEVKRAYQQLGIIHLLAISGLHVGIILSFFYFVFLRIGFTKEQVWLLLFLCLPLYCIFAGAAPSVVRSCLMAGVFLIAKWRKIEVSPLDCLSISLILIILFDREQVQQIGFQLSYIVTTALILSHSILLRCKSYIRMLMMVTLIAQLSSLPILLYYFYEFSWLSLVVNLFFVPLYVYVILPLTLFTTVLIFIHLPFYDFFSQFLDFIFSMSSSFVSRVSSWDWHTITIGAISLVELCLLYGIFIHVMVYLEKEEKKIVTLFVTRILFCVLCLFAFRLFHPGEVTVLDVGQGDAIFIQEERRGNAYLIDTGGLLEFQSEETWQQRTNKFELGEDLLLPFLKSKGVGKLKALFLTHGDADHIGEAVTVLKRVDVEYLIISPYFGVGFEEEEVLRVAKERGTKIVIVKGGDSLSFSTSFKVLSPVQKMESSNDNSLVLQADIGGLSWLFVGDLEQKGEEILMGKYPNLQVDVLKVGHHGSKTSTSKPFLQMINPNMAIISSGRKNRFGHPHKEVIDRLDNEEIQILRTDTMGAIKYQFRGSTGTFYTFPPYDEVNQ